ncbi:acyl carrier protein [Bacillus pseudomycoides]|uniref:acyl carrier protein n=1 Tax=Bacillus pseudomycoides TaxID=64104 RepID=UPI0001A161BE|nr:phosphopantetheine-binding protein [Bacillus pseudomycoides]EEM05977.1 hypothetical protein bmyco0002_15820 [Bacillus pseudomycoides]PEJ27555.1 D-alanyl carrier protein [Bacillus pseudomycoides]PFW89610.1 D-alanyl carrier protein [Bacillus pseudomycoides]PFX45012.1 D-alanyl carrier protein [Bacillus pseudomycoides]PFY87579.1 D-alanyl carrier protein [Bacillus pseudomycoides]
MENKGKIRSFLGRFTQNFIIEDDTNIFELGVVNSLFAMQLVVFVETEFGITFSNEDLDFSNFKSINTISELIDRKLNQKTV